MLKREIIPYSRDYCRWFAEAYDVLKENFDGNYTDEICKLRGYVSKEHIKFIDSLNLGRCDIENVADLGEHRRELGLVTKQDKFIMPGRYIIPVNDIVGNIVALVGWYPDKKKYITTPSVFFSKDTLFFNIDKAFKLSWEKYDGICFLVEGMFDCISLSSIGLPVMATMGSTVSYAKAEQLKIFRKVVGIPDNDRVGRSALNRYSPKGWHVPDNATMLRLRSEGLDIDGTHYSVKDTDDLVKYFEADSLREILLSFADSKEEIEDLII